MRPVDRLPRHADLCGMTTVAECLTQLVPLIQAGGDNALILAENQIEQFVLAAPGDRDELVLALGDLQDKLYRQTTPSPLRSDVLDAIGSRIVQVLEADGRLDS